MGEGSTHRIQFFFDFESMLYCYEIKAYFLKNLFLSYFFAFRISQHFAPGSAFVRKVEGFSRFIFSRHLRKIRKVYCECFVIRGVFRENIPRNAKYEKCMAGLTATQL